MQKPGINSSMQKYRPAGDKRREDEYKNGKWKGESPAATSAAKTHLVQPVASSAAWTKALKVQGGGGDERRSPQARV